MTVPVAPAAGEPIAEAWGDVVHDSIVAMDIQSGTVSIPAAGAPTSSVTVIFPRPFAAAPQAAASTNGTISGVWIAQISTTTPTQLTVYVFARDGRNVTALGAHWIAYGPRA